MKILNTLSRQKEEFHPQGRIVTMYVCGVTVYDDCHIGHAMSYIIFDTIRRYLEYKGYEVKHIQNFTDIDDKIINRANQLGISARDLAEKYINEYFKDMDALNIKRATLYPKATEEIPKIIDIINGLIQKDYAYIIDGSVYFRVRRTTEYGKLSHQKTGEMIAESTAESEKKDSALDFALWKAVKPGEPSWESPWGPGRPGWHIECTAMSLKYLGESIDIHGGGQDLIFPHHENEIAQSEGYTGCAPFVKYWMHNGLLQLRGDKMSKSLGNLITVKDMLKQYSPDTIRLFILNSHYRSPLLYSEESLAAAAAGMERIRQAAKANESDDMGTNRLDPLGFEQRFVESMDEDFNTAQAIAALFDLAREINKGRESKMNVADARNRLAELAMVLGFTLSQPERQPIAPESLVGLLIAVRDDLRSAKQWQIADKIRDKLSEMGIILEDSPQGTTWKRL